MSPELAKAMQGALPLIGIFGTCGLIWAIKMLIERSRNISRSIDHVWVEIWPKVGKAYNYLTPILTGGTIRIQDRNGNEFARYILSKGSAIKADWPPGKSNFVQVTVDKIVYRENDAIPIAEAVGDRPSFDAHQLDALVENVATAAAEVTRISMEESKGTTHKQNPFLYVYIGLGILAVGIIYLIATQHNIPEILNNIANTINNIANQQGIQIGPKPTPTPLPK